MHLHTARGLQCQGAGLVHSLAKYSETAATTAWGGHLWGVQIRGPPVPPSRTRKHLYFSTQAAGMCFADQVGRIRTFLQLTHARLLIPLCRNLHRYVRGIWSGHSLHLSSILWWWFFLIFLLPLSSIIHSIQKSSVHSFSLLPSNTYHSFVCIHSFLMSSFFFPPLSHSLLIFCLSNVPLSSIPYYSSIHSLYNTIHPLILSPLPSFLSSFLQAFILAGTRFRSKDREWRRQ